MSTRRLLFCTTLLVCLVINGIVKATAQGSSNETSTTKAPPAAVLEPLTLFCSLPLGMEKGHIKDEDITASSAFDFKSVGPHNARLGKDVHGGAWCPKKMIAPGVREWIQIDLHRPYRLTRTATQGRFGGGQGQEYAEEFLLEYWRPSLGEWRTYRNHSGHSLMPGNTNTYVANVNVLTPPIVASKVRFVPHSQHPRTVCMRVEVFGCHYEEGIVSYNAPPGDEFAPNFYLEDVYDGDEDVNDKGGPMLVNGLGVLTDGLYGGNVSLSHSGLSSAHGWIGWNNKNRPLTIIFEFGDRQEFESVTLTSFCQLSLGIQPFSQMLAYFSLDGTNYHSQYVKSVNKQAITFGQPQNITLQLGKRVGKFAKVELYFDNKWMLLSEIRFDSKQTTKDMVISSGHVLDSVFSSDNENNNNSDDMIEIANEDNESSGSGSNVLADTPHPPNNEDGGAAMKSGKHNLSSTENNQIYIGLVIGVLGVTVILLLVIILAMMSRNKQKIFNKHSMFKSPLSDRHMMRDLTPLNGCGPGVNSKHYDDSDHEESNSIYHEPYRLVLQRGTHRNNSCGRLCDRDYEDLGLLMEQKNKFGSTPLFNIPPAPPAANGNTARPKFTGPTSYSCHEVKNGYAIPGGNTMPSTLNENFYAATDIVLKPMEQNKQQPSPPQRNQHIHHVQMKQQSPKCPEEKNKPLDGELFTTMQMPTGSPNGQLDEVSGGLLPVQEYPRHQLRLVEKLGDGAFGMVHLCETDPLLDNSNLKGFHSFNDFRKTVVVRSLWKGASQQKRNAFVSTIRRLAALKDANIAQVVAVCTQDEPLCVMSEFSEYGDLCQFLKSHPSPSSHYSNTSDLNTSCSSTSSGISTSTLVYIGTQIASGMKYLESHGFVHRDLASRNCLIGTSYQIKISDCAMFRPIYSGDYYRDTEQNSGQDILPLRWIPWEIYVMRLWSTKSDVWSFGVTLWEIFTYCQDRPLGELTDNQVVDNLKHWFHSDGFHLTPTRPSMHQCTKEMFDLILQCWSREPEERPRFGDIYQFLQNKCVGYSVD